jgi:hypothetical protein
VYFAAECEMIDESAELRDPRLIMIRQGVTGQLSQRARQAQGGRVELDGSRLYFSIGTVREIDEERVEKLDRCRRHIARDLSHLPETPAWQLRLSEIAQSHPRVIVYAGSGLGYEAGVPTLATMHKLFGVDDGPGTDFCLGDSDPLLDDIADNGFSRFVDQVEAFHSICAKVQPSTSHVLLAKAFEKGVASLILTDNVDEIFERRLGIQTTKTRGDGLISVKYPRMENLLEQVKSKPHVLLVAGVSADRRGIIEALSTSIPTVVVNPAWQVSPESKNLDYLSMLGFDESGLSAGGHVFVKQPAHACLAQVLSSLTRDR